MAAMLLVSKTEAMDWGFDLTTPALRRASARIRGYLRQDVTAGTSTIQGRGPQFRLPQRPVVAVTSVTDSDGHPVEFEVQPGAMLVTNSMDLLTVTYSHGYDLAAIPDELVELVCQVAVRLGATPDTPLAQGMQSHTSGQFSVTYGAQAFQSASGLTDGEQKTLRRYWPPTPNLITMGGPTA